MRNSSDRAQLLAHRKQTSSGGLLQEIKIWKVPVSAKYPDGLKYRLALVDPVTSEVLLLFDNHWPKGHHKHVRGEEKLLEFSTLANLVREFDEQSLKMERHYRENQKN